MIRDVLAGWRLVRLAREDTIADALRERVRTWAKRPTKRGRCTATTLYDPGRGSLKTTSKMLVHCVLDAGHESQHVSTPGGWDSREGVVEIGWTDEAADALPHNRPSHPKVLEFLTCSWCLSIWAAAVVVVLRRRAPWLRDVLATSQAVGLLDEAVRRRNG